MLPLLIALTGLLVIDAIRQEKKLDHFVRKNNRSGNF